MSRRTLGAADVLVLVGLVQLYGGAWLLGLAVFAAVLAVSGVAFVAFGIWVSRQ